MTPEDDKFERALREDIERAPASPAFADAVMRDVRAAGKRRPARSLPGWLRAASVVGAVAAGVVAFALVANQTPDAASAMRDAFGPVKFGIKDSEALNLGVAVALASLFLTLAFEARSGRR